MLNPTQLVEVFTSEIRRELHELGNVDGIRSESRDYGVDGVLAEVGSTFRDDGCHAPLVFLVKGFECVSKVGEWPEDSYFRPINCRVVQRRIETGKREKGDVEIVCYLGDGKAIWRDAGY